MEILKLLVEARRERDAILTRAIELSEAKKIAQARKLQKMAIAIDERMKELQQRITPRGMKGLRVVIQRKHRG